MDRKQLLMRDLANPDCSGVSPLSPPAPAPGRPAFLSMSVICLPMAFTCQ